MNTNIKKTLLMLYVLISHAHATSTSLPMQKQQTPTAIESRIKNLTTFCEYNGIPPHEMDIIVIIAYTTFQNNFYTDLDHDQQLRNTIIIDYYTEKIASTLRTIEKQENITINAGSYNTLFYKHKNALLTALSDNKNIGHLVGDNLTALLYQDVFNAETQQKSAPNNHHTPTQNNHIKPTTPTPPAPPASQPHTHYSNNFHQQELAQQYVEKLEKDLIKTTDKHAIVFLSKKDIDTLKKLTINSLSSENSTSECDTLAHTKNGIRGLLDAKLEKAQSELEQEGYATDIVQTAGTAIRNKKNIAIKQLKKIDAHDIATIINHGTTKNDIRDHIRKQRP